MKKVMILILFVLLIGIVLAFTFSNKIDISNKTNKQVFEPKTETLSNISGLYSLFTPYMKDFVDSHLNLLNCRPEEYYYTENNDVNNAICFICGKLDLCYRYITVRRSGGILMMNPNGLFLVGDYNQKDILNLYSYGVIDAINCECDENGCFCENDIDVVVVHETSTYIVFSFPVNSNIETEVRNIAMKMGKQECKNIDDSLIVCGDLGARKIENNKVSFGKW